VSLRREQQRHFFASGASRSQSGAAVNQAHGCVDPGDVR
jgi:hypothetical protein